MGERLEKEIAEAMSQNRKLKEPLQKARETNDELKRQLANYEKDKRCLKSSQTRLAAQKEEMKELKWEHEVLEQRFQKLQSERDELHANFVTAVQEVVQKANFKKLLLERKLSLWQIHSKRKMLSSTRSWPHLIWNQLLCLLLLENSKMFSMPRMEPSKIYSTNWLVFAKLTTICYEHTNQNY